MKLRLFICTLLGASTILLTGCLATNAAQPTPQRPAYRITMIDKDTVQVAGQTMPADQLPEFLMAKGIDPQNTIIVQGKSDTPIRDIKRITDILNRANYRNTSYSSLRP